VEGAGDGVPVCSRDQSSGVWGQQCALSVAEDWDREE